MSKFNKQRDTRPIANKAIRHETVRVNMPDGSSEVMKTKDALSVASELEMDLVLIADQATPPVCRVVNLNKFLYEKKQKEKEAKKRQRENAIEQKEIRLGINIEMHDLETKVKQADKFLSKGNVIVLTVILKGRERSKPEIAIELLKKFGEMLDVDIGKINRSGNRISVRITK